ncbi:hypothetical protein FSARC_3512 [Fusarium sarcochroum]|uniref:Uncharacterized protein n=1 Tax=Fusarium sarcochroum TaxID=1208366 RepID=A0A8H4XCL5_9HYPO|nr:hypothetical protein FSARC_3512 [Fusarium sarcochroum]
MKFSIFFITAFVTFATAAPGVFSPFAQGRAALNQSEPSRDREDGREGGRGDGRGEDGEEDRGEEDRGDDGEEDGEEEGRNRGGLAFRQVDLNYLLQVNELDLGKLQTLSRKNSLNVAVFADLFTSKDFSLKSLLELQKLSTTLKIAETGIFDKFELSKLELGGLELGLIDGIASIDLTKFIDAALEPKITVIAKKVNKVVLDIGK